MRIVVRFSAEALAGANAGVDLGQSSERYAQALREAIVAELGGAEVSVAREDGAALTVLVDDAPDRQRAEIERTVTDLAWVVKQCAPWSVASTRAVP